MFRITQGKGFQMVFANGLEVSVQWGKTNYCGRRDLDAPFSMREIDAESQDAEVCVFRGPDTIGCETGWMSPEEAAAIIALVATWEMQASPANDEILAAKLAKI